MEGGTSHSWNSRLWLSALSAGLLIVFFCFRPLNDPQYRIIVADGLGYYAYLPAKFIHNDSALAFAWFPEVFESHYDDHTFEDPLRHFMVDYGSRKINLYYPGVSLLQAPFFFTGHALAPACGFASDGFPLPYQLAIGLSGLFYTVLGLFFLARLLMSLTGNYRRAWIITVLMLTGTPLFTWSVFNGCYSHCYSFCFITAFYLVAQRSFENGFTWTRIKLILLTSLIVISIRPVNMIALPGVFFFFRRPVFADTKFRVTDLVLLLALALVVYYNVSITRTQTGSSVANTYTIGKFLWTRFDRILTNLFGFRQGILWYSPLLLICFMAVVICRRQPRVLWLLFTAGVMFVLYSLWWYWPVLGRTLVDITAVFALLLTLLLTGLRTKKTLRIMLIAAFLSAALFQLKAYQLREGILHPTYTYWKYYLKYFFVTGHRDVYPVDPRTVLFSEEHFDDFESTGTRKRSFSGKSSCVLDHANEFAATRSYAIPVGLSATGFPRMKCAFWLWRDEAVTDVRLVAEIIRNTQVMEYRAFYINEATGAGEWSFKEFGMDLHTMKGDSVRIYFWNPGRRSSAFIDDLKTGFYLTNGDDEVTDK